MAVEITRCVTDDDYEQWRQVRIAILPLSGPSPWPSCARATRPTG